MTERVTRRAALAGSVALPMVPAAAMARAEGPEVPGQLGLLHAVAAMTDDDIDEFAIKHRFGAVELLLMRDKARRLLAEVNQGRTRPSPRTLREAVSMIADADDQALFEATDTPAYGLDELARMRREARSVVRQWAG